MREGVQYDKRMNSGSQTPKEKVLLINPATFIEHFQVQGTVSGVEEGAKRIKT